MNANSRDNVNVEATVTCTAYDRNGDIVDQDRYHGRYEPATRLLDFMLNCEAMFGRQGAKIIRYTCEVAYVLAAIVFLSSAHVEAARGLYSDHLPDVNKVSSGDVYSTDARTGVVRRIRVAPKAPPAKIFEEQQKPVRFLKELSDWPPYPRDYILNKSQQLARRAWEHVQKVMNTSPSEPKQGWVWWHPVLFIAGLGLLLTVIGFSRWRVLSGS